MNGKIFETGLHYPISLTDLPPTWIYDYVGAYTKLIESGFACGAHNQSGDGVQHLRPMNISTAGKIDLEDARHVPAAFNNKRLSQNDVLFNNTNSPPLVGKTAVIDASAAGKAFSNHMTRVVFCEAVEPRFAARQLNFLFSSGYFLHRCVKHVNQASISSSELGRTVPLILPPLNEQKRIVAKIEELFSELEAGEENLRKARRQLGVYRQSLLKQAFEGKLTEKWRTQNPAYLESWTSTTIGKIGRIETGTTPPTDNQANYGGNLPFFKPTDLEQGRYVKDSRSHLSATGRQSARVLPAGSILVTCIGATIGKTGLAQLTCATNQQINSISPAEDISAEFVYFQVIGPQFQEQIKTNASSTTLPILNKSKFSALPFVRCSRPEQQEIVRLLDEQFEVIERNEREIEAALKRSEALRQAILKKAFTGRLVSQDLTDEPSAVLLAQIREPRRIFAPQDYFAQLIPALLRVYKASESLEWLNAAIALLFKPRILMPMAESAGAEHSAHFKHFKQPLTETAFADMLRLLVQNRVIRCESVRNGVRLHLIESEAPPIDPIVFEDARHLGAILPVSPVAEVDVIIRKLSPPSLSKELLAMA